MSDLQGYESDGEYDDLPERVACVCVRAFVCVRARAARIFLCLFAIKRERVKTGEASAASNH